MKKLLFSAIATAGLAFGLQADNVLEGTSFEGVTAPVGLSEATSMTYLGTGAAFNIPDDDANQKLEVTAYGQGEAITGNRPDAFTGDQDNYLAVKTTFGKPLTLGLAEATPANGIYFDSLVKFTACDEDPDSTNYADAKLLVYTKENAEGTGTNIFVRAGVIGGEAKAYDCGPFTGGDWSRLTIKSIVDPSAGAAFVVFIDKVALKCADSKGFGDLDTEAAFWNGANALFPSLAPLAQVISAVGFDGQGGIDDIVLTSTAPAFMPKAAVLTVSYGKGLSKVAYTTATASKTVTVDAEGGSFAVPFDSSDAATVTLAITPATDWGVKDVTAEDAEATGSDNAWTIAINMGTAAPTATIVTKDMSDKLAVKIGDADPVNYPDFATAFAAITEGGGTASIALIKDVEVGGEDYTSEAYINADSDITIDLAGNTITGTYADGFVFEVAGKLTITDSVGSGEIVATDAAGAVFVGDGAAFTALGGKYTGVIAEAEDPETAPVISIVAGTFAGEAGGFYLADKVPEGSKVEYDDNGYYVVSLPPKKGWAIYLAEGENENEFLIEDADDLTALATHIGESDDFATAGVTFKLTDNVNFENAVFAGIGTEAAPFVGTFDGDGKVISGYKLPATTTYEGFFMYLDGATIKNVTFAIAGFDTPADGFTGEYGGAAVAGKATGAAKFINVTANGTLTGGALPAPNHTLAGLAVQTTGSAVFEDCTNNVNIVNAQNKKTAGFVGTPKQTGTQTLTFTRCVNNGNIDLGAAATGDGGTAAFCGWTSYSAVVFEDCVNNGAISSVNAAQLGSFCGKLYGTIAVTLNGTCTTTALGIPAMGTADLQATEAAAFNFATVNNGVATFPATPAVGGTYKVMLPTATASITLAKGETVTFDKSVAAGTINVDTSAGDGYQVVENSGVYSVAPKTFNITYTYTGAEDTTGIVNGNPTEFTVETSDITIDLTKITLTGYTATAANPASIDCSEQTADVPVTITLTADAPQKWPDDPEDVKGQTAGDAFGLTGELATADAVKVAEWAKAKGVAFGDKATINVEAMLLNIANDGDIAAAKAEFKFSAEDLAALLANPDAATSLAEKYPYAQLTIGKFSDAACTTEWQTGDSQEFFKATLTVPQVK